MQQTNWIVITGGPCSGKTTLLDYLKSQGYFTIPEAARVFIDTEIDKGRTLQNIRSNEELFQKEVLEMKIKVEESLPTDQITFFDRGVPDNIAYCQFHGMDISSALQASQKRRYKEVFLLEQIPFEKDYARTEGEKQAYFISELLFKTYSDLGYSIFRIPLLSVEDRVKIVLEKTLPI